MVQFDNISDAERKLVAERAAPLLLQLQGPSLGGPGAPMVLGTSLGEEMITPEWVATEDDDSAAAPLHSTGQTISIVEAKDSVVKGGRSKSGSVAVGYVRHATRTGDETAPLQITAVSGSEIATHIREALEWIKARVPGDSVIRVLTAPAYHLTAIGVYSGKTLTGILAVTPSPGGAIENQRLYSPSEFRRLLRSVIPASGISP
jgi:hypothetical protein